MPRAPVRLSIRYGLLRVVPWVLAVAAASAAHAQGLSELYESARAYDATYLAARAQAESVQYRAEQARAQRRPSIGLQAGASRSNTQTPYTNTLSQHQTAGQVGLNAQQSLFNRPNDITIEQADRGVEVAAAQLRAAEQDLIIRVAQAYFDVLAAQDALVTTRANKTAITEQLASAKRNFEVGTATITDTREAQARFDLATAQEIAADNELRTRLLALSQLVGRQNVDPRALAQPVALPALMPDDAEPWVLAADVQNPGVQQARLAYDIAKLETEKARAGHLPTLALNGSVGRNRATVDGNANSLGVVAPYANSGYGNNSSIGVTMNMPLFAGFAIQNRVKETISLEEKARNDLEAARRNAAQGARSAFLAVQSGVAQVKALEAAEASSQLALEATQLGYKVGVRVNLDVLNAQTQLFTTRRDLARARYDVIVGGLKLRQVSGQLQPGDVGAVNAVLAKSPVPQPQILVLSKPSMAPAKRR